MLVTGIALFAVNDLALFDVGLMPGGHNEIWAPTAIVLVVSSRWWFGWLDRPQGRPVTDRLQRRRRP